MSIEFEGVDENGFGIIKSKSPSTDIAKTFDSFKKIITTNEYVKNNLHKYILLTKREKEILHLFTSIHSQQEIADTLYISLHTLHTHWKNIKNKLQIPTGEEIYVFAKALDTTHLNE